MDELDEVMTTIGDSQFLYKLSDWIMGETGNVNAAQRLNGLAIAIECRVAKIKAIEAVVKEE